MCCPCTTALVPSELATRTKHLPKIQTMYSLCRQTMYTMHTLECQSENISEKPFLVLNNKTSSVRCYVGRRGLANKIHSDATLRAPQASSKQRCFFLCLVFILFFFFFLAMISFSWCVFFLFLFFRICVKTAKNRARSRLSLSSRLSWQEVSPLSSRRNGNQWHPVGTLPQSSWDPGNTQRNSTLEPEKKTPQNRLSWTSTTYNQETTTNKIIKTKKHLPLHFEEWNAIFGDFDEPSQHTLLPSPHNNTVPCVTKHWQFTCFVWDSWIVVCRRCKVVFLVGVYLIRSIWGHLRMRCRIWPTVFDSPPAVVAIPKFRCEYW